MEGYSKKAEENLLEIQKQKEESDREMLRLEIIIGYISSIIFMILIFLASYVKMHWAIKLLLIIGGSVIFSIGLINTAKIEQIAGYYECGKCHYKHVPKFMKVLFSLHYGRTRYIKCPKCGQKSWNKKTITKEG